MHTYYGDWTSISDLGSTDRVAYNRVSGPTNNGNIHISPDRLDELNLRHANDALSTATADGKISSTEKKLFEQPDAKQAVDEQVKQLHSSVQPRLTYTEQPVYTRSGVHTTRTDYGKQVSQLAKDKQQHHDLDSLKDTAKTFAAGSDGRKAMDAQIASRTKAEATVVSAIKDKTQLIGALEGEKINVEASKPKIAKDDFQQLREQAQPFLDVFNKYDGQDYSPDTFGDDWDSVKGDYTFDQMVKQFRNKPDQLKVWANHQDNPESKAAVGELTKVMAQYEAARTDVEAADARIGDINAEQDGLRNSIKDDRTALSDSTLKQLDGDLSRPAPTSSGPHISADRAEEIAQRKADEHRTQAAADRADKLMRLNTAEDVTRDRRDAKHAAHDADAPGKDTRPNQTTPSSTTTPTTKPVKSADDIVRAHNNLGDHYTVQPGDSLWKIANEYSKAYGVQISWRDVYESNKTIVGKPQVVNGTTFAMIHPGQVLMIPGIAEKIDEEATRSIGDSPR